MSIKIQYTAWAKTMIKSLHDDITRKIEEEITKERIFPWADFIEINEKDIKEYSSRLQIKKWKSSNYNLYLIAYTYSLVGLITFLGPTIYNEIKITYITNDAIIMLTWIIFTVMWIFTYMFVKLKEKQYKNDIIQSGNTNQELMAELMVKILELEKIRNSK